MVAPDYQIYDLVDGKPENIGPRMQKKLSALDGVLPEDLSGKSVLDVGTDFGFWAFLCAQRGAVDVLGIDRGREVKGYGYVDLVDLNNERSKDTTCWFKKANIGKQWLEFGKFDYVLLMSLYHHIYHQCGDHNPIWYWLSRHVREKLIWENPTDATDAVVKLNVDGSLHPKYNKGAILGAASQYFDCKYIGPAEHETTRSVYEFTPRKVVDVKTHHGATSSGAGGASKAFCHNNGRRIGEIKTAIGVKCYPGSLNVFLEDDFDWDSGYYRSRVSDLADRRKGLDSHWVPRWARLYPILIEGMKAHVFRFEGERYPKNFIEIISDRRLRDHLGDKVNVTRYT